VQLVILHDRNQLDRFGWSEAIGAFMEYHAHFRDRGARRRRLAYARLIGARRARTYVCSSCWKAVVLTLGRRQTIGILNSGSFWQYHTWCVLSRRLRFPQRWPYLWGCRIGFRDLRRAWACSSAIIRQTWRPISTPSIACGTSRKVPAAKPRAVFYRRFLQGPIRDCGSGMTGNSGGIIHIPDRANTVR